MHGEFFELAVLMKLVVKSLDRDTLLVCGSSFGAIEMPSSLQDVTFFKFMQSHLWIVIQNVFFSFAVTDIIRNVVQHDHVTFRQDLKSFADVLQFTDISWPVITNQGFHRF